MDLYEFFNTFIEAAANDAALDAWANINFSRDVNVYADLDFDEAPGEDEMPYMVFHSPGKSAHQERRITEYTLGVWLVIYQTGNKTRTEDNLTEPSGVELITDFITKVQTLIKDVVPSNFVVGFDIDTDTIGMLPEIHAYMDIAFQERITIGSDPLSIT